MSGSDLAANFAAWIILCVNIRVGQAIHDRRQRRVVQCEGTRECARGSGGRWQRRQHIREVGGIRRPMNVRRIRCRRQRSIVDIQEQLVAYARQSARTRAARHHRRRPLIGAIQGNLQLGRPNLSPDFATGMVCVVNVRIG